MVCGVYGLSSLERNNIDLSPFIAFSQQNLKESRKSQVRAKVYKVIVIDTQHCMINTFLNSTFGSCSVIIINILNVGVQKNPEAFPKKRNQAIPV